MRERDYVPVEAVEQISPELADRRKSVQILVGSGDHAHIRGHRVAPPTRSNR